MLAGITDLLAEPGVEREFAFQWLLSASIDAGHTAKAAVLMEKLVDLCYS